MLQPIILIDSYVHAHQLLDASTNVPNDKLSTWAKANWILRLARPLQLETFIDATPICVVDGKVNGQYWRHLEFAEYKGTRSPKSDRFQVIYNELPKLTKVWHCDWMEADDLIAEAWRIQQKGEFNRHIYISSVDHDLLQMVGPTCTFVSTGPWTPRVKDEPAALAYVYKKHKVHLKSMQEFAKLKTIYGDKGDNLPKGCDYGLVDLIAPPCTYGQHSIYNWSELSEYTAALQTQIGNTFTERAPLAARWCLANGLNLASFH